MDEFEVSLLTPASDLVGGSSSAELEGIFARAGNDLIYGFDPGIDYPEINVDFLIGDLFDNSADEFEVITGIIQGDPLGILDRNIPSVGRDRFVLGDESRPYYTAANPFSLLTTNFLGFNEFAVIYDFDFATKQDTIQLFGDKKDYVIIEVNDLEVEGSSRPFSGEAVFYVGNGVPDLVTYIVSTPNQDIESKDFEIKDKAFEFVGDKVKDKAQEKEILQLGTPGIDVSQDTAIDRFGNIYVTGTTSGALGGQNKGLIDVWVAKYNANGNQQWIKQFGSAASDTANEITTDEAGNFYIAGSTGGSFVGPKQASSQDAWVAKFDPNGNRIWGTQFNAGAQVGRATFSNTAFGLEVQGDSVYVSGLAINDNVKLNPATGQPILDFPVEDDAWVTKINAFSGNQNWITQIRDPQAGAPFIITPFFDENYDLAVDAAGNTYQVGWTQGLVKEADPSRLLLKYDAWLSKVDPNGQIQWVQQFGSRDEGLEFGWAVETDSQGNIYATGWTNGELGEKTNPDSDSYDVWVSKFTPDGTQLFTKQIGSEGDDGTYLSDIAIDDQDNVYLIGYTNDKLGKGKSDEEGFNAWVAKLDSNGNEQWIQQFGTKEQTDYPTGIAVENGQVIVTGFTEGSLGNGNGATNNGDAIDSWIARFSAEKGKLEKFIGDDKDGFITAEGVDIDVTDISNQFVTDEFLPSGDNKIITGFNFADYGDIVSGLAEYFDPRESGTFTDALGKAITNGSVTGLEDYLGGGADTKGKDYKGTDGNDTYFGGAGEDKIKGEKGNDELYGMGGDDKVEGKDGDDILHGGAGNDEVKGGKGFDTLIGVDEGSPLAGLGEIDKMKGEDQADLFVLGNKSSAFYKGNGADDYGLIDDFEFKEGDKIQLHGQAGDYTLGSNVSDVPKGTAIFLKDGNDLIGVVKDIKSGLNLTNSNVFSYVA
ncbi:MAG: SBBP repeat-containing protein [Cyanobacteria bacterium J06635_1]